MTSQKQILHGLMFKGGDMELRKLTAPSLTELFVTELESKILSGELKVGDKLPSERELAASMKVSRAVVNAGIAEMEQKGFLFIRPRIGTFVADYRKNGTLETLVSIMRYNGGTLARSEVKSILELRVVLMTLVGALCIENVSDEDLNDHLNPILDQLREGRTNEEIVDATYRLHHELAFISGNALLPLIFASFRDLVCGLWLRYVVNYGKDALIASDEALVDYLLKRDFKGVTEHIWNGSKESIIGSRQIYD